MSAPALSTPAGLAMFQQAIAAEPMVALVDLTRLAVTYDLMPVEEIRAIVALFHNRGALVYVDDAGGASQAGRL
jgi:hypothetical protein